jgi:S-adenosylmethionine:tRNA ribosyltransferase-isomerase
VPDSPAGFTLDFTLPPELEAGEPPEARGLARDEVRLMVSYYDDDYIEHARFRDIGRFLVAGDLLVINTSGTMNAALPAWRADGTALELHLSTFLPDGRWSVELRLPQDGATVPFLTAQVNERLTLPEGACVQLHQPYAPGLSALGGVRLWRATLRLPSALHTYLARYGFPIRYRYVREQWAPMYYQTVFATETGSAEMPSAGRAFTPELVTRLVAQGVQFAPVLLHTGVASLEDHEPPYAEYYRVSEDTARIVNTARAAGKRIIAVGTTVVRALETVTDSDGVSIPVTHAGTGWTDVVVTPERGIHAVNGLLTGLHEPRATHLAMLEALTNRAHLRSAYMESLQERYLWHEFGDLHLLLPYRA